MSEYVKQGYRPLAGMRCFSYEEDNYYEES